MTSLEDIKLGLKSSVKKYHRLSQEDFSKKVFDIYGNDYIIIGEYVNSLTKIRVRHNSLTCNHEWDTSSSNFFKGNGCPKCGCKRQTDGQRLTHEEFVNKFIDRFGDEYDILEKYKTAKVKLKIRHKLCNYIFSLSPDSLLHGNGCPKCNSLSVRCRDTDFFKKEVFDLVGNEYKVLGEFTRTKDKISMEHSSCGNVWSIEPTSFLVGNRCPCCQKSKGEKAIKKYLESKNIMFKEQYRFNDCRNINPLPFDFAIIDDEFKILCLIEYDGEQHYKPMRFTNSDNAKELSVIQARDSLKTDYCIKNNIPLIRIPYWKLKDIDDVLNREIQIKEEEVDKNDVA